ncbi:Pol protein, partial [Phytophthora palmivora]
MATSMDLRESKGRGQVSVRLADGTVVNVPGVRMDLAVTFEEFDSTESFIVLDMDKYDLILGMPWLDKHEPWIDLQARQGANAPEEVLGVTDSNEDVAMSLATGLPDGTDQAGNLGPRKVEETEKKNKSAACVSSVGNRAPRGVKKTSTRAEVSLSTSHVDNKAPHSESETPPARPVEEQCHVFDGVSGRQVKAGDVHLEPLPEVSALLNLEELSMKVFLAELKAGEIAEM